MNTKLSSLLAGAVLATGTFLSPFIVNAEEGPLMPGPKDDKTNQNAIFDPNPGVATSFTNTNRIVVYGVDPSGTPIPAKYLRITNNSGRIVYPIMRDVNSTLLPDNKGVGLYDPFDDPDREYRGYIGYKGEDGKYHFGLKNGESILVKIPLVFWNGARIGIGTDDKFLAPDTKPNPTNWDSNAKRSITVTESENVPDAEGEKGKMTGIKNGVVMWYRSEIAKAPNDDTEDQLAEWTIRDHGYLVSPGVVARTGMAIPDSELVTLLNYDVSNVDNLFMPMSMQAFNAELQPQGAGTGDRANRDGWTPGGSPAVNGWTGSIRDIAFLQKNIREFTESPNELLGAYFPDNKGWPHYNMPGDNEPGALLKIPAGANIFAQSPLKDVTSSYSTGDWSDNKYMLSSGGSTSKFVTLSPRGGTFDKAGDTKLHLLFPTPATQAMYDYVKNEKVLYVSANPAPDVLNPIEPGTTVAGIEDGGATIILSKALKGSSESNSFTFRRPGGDYAATAMIKLWFSWAEYYRTHWKDGRPDAPDSVTIKGSLKKKSAWLAFNEPHKELVEGMAIKGGGLDEAQTETGLIHKGDAIILEVAKDGKSVLLSQMPAFDVVNGDFTFRAPPELLWTAKAKELGAFYNNDFKFAKEDEWRKPYEFSLAVYKIMASMDQIGEKNNDTLLKYMQNIIGANMGYIFDQKAKDARDGQMVIANIRDLIKSVLRGVSDFTKYPDVMNGKEHLHWYPDPKEKIGGVLDGREFNVFNMDPFVWFVHVRLGFSGYGFSIDDDTADIGAGGASKLQLVVTGTDGLRNEHEWTNQAPFGPVTETLEYSGTADMDTLYYDVEKTSSTTPITITSREPHKLLDGAKVFIENVTGNMAANGVFTIHNVTDKTFDLFDEKTGLVPVASNGTAPANPTGRFGRPKAPYIKGTSDLNRVFNKVTGDDSMGTYLGTFVTGPQLSKKDSFRIWQRGKRDIGQLILNEPLKDENGDLLKPGTYTFTFSGAHPVKEVKK